MTNSREKAFIVLCHEIRNIIRWSMSERRKLQVKHYKRNFYRSAEEFYPFDNEEKFPTFFEFSVIKGGAKTKSTFNILCVKTTFHRHNFCFYYLASEGSF